MEARDELQQPEAGEGDLRGLVEFICRSLVDDPDGVRVEEIDEDADLILEVSVEDEDLGRLIGRGGKVAGAIRTVTKAAARAGAASDRRVLVEFVED
jgi:predicted RNA-binding protein YlqC (UPF0109 family)